MIRLDRRSKRIAGILLLGAVALYQFYQGQSPGHGTSPQPDRQTSEQSQETGRFVDGGWLMLEARVTRILDDDSQGSRHQRFIIELPDRRTLLVAHNIDLAERVPVASGDPIKLRGRFESNKRGGVMHWTHHDPASSASAGWIEHQGRRYQ